MKKLFSKGKEAIEKNAAKISTEVRDGMKIITEVINGLPVIASFERFKTDEVVYDEKHYFVVPLHSGVNNNEAGFSLHTMRALPEGVPEINKLPKRRVFHFPNEHYEETLRAYMLQAAQGLVQEHNQHTQHSLESLADSIDILDNKLTYGMLFVGSVAAIFNPIIGAGIALKAVLPSVTGMFTKYGLRPAAEKLSRKQVEKQVREAEKQVMAQFSDATTVKVNNPILHQLEYALRTNEWEYDPLLDPNLSYGDIPQLGTQAWRRLTEIAIYHVYKDIVDKPNEHAKAKLGPEDIRWLKVMFVGIDHSH